MLARNVIVQALREALNSLGAPRDATMELVGFTAPMVAPDITVRTDVEQLDWDGDSERFTGMLAISGDNMAVQRLRVSGALQEMSELPVAAHRLPAGTVIQPGDLVVRHVRTALARGGVVQDVVQALGKTVQHIVAAGQPLPTNDITTSAVVLKGAKVTMQLQSPGLTLLAQGTALENGGLGDRIAVLNPTSRAVVIAEIIAGDRVRVTPGNLVTLQASANPAGDDRRTLP
jgi:flagella basal body P-ring formation protein FlgA